MDSSKGFESASETLQLLFRVLGGESAAIEQVDPFLKHRAQSYTRDEALRPALISPGSPSRQPGSRGPVSFENGTYPSRGENRYQAPAYQSSEVPAHGPEFTRKASETRRPTDDIAAGDPDPFQVLGPQVRSLNTSGGQWRAKPEVAASPSTSGDQWRSKPEVVTSQSHHAHRIRSPQHPTSDVLRRSDSEATMTAQDKMHGFGGVHGSKASGPMNFSKSGSLPDLQSKGVPSSIGQDASRNKKRRGRVSPSRASPQRVGSPISLSSSSELRIMKASGSPPVRPNSRGRTSKAIGEGPRLKKGTPSSLQLSGSGIIMAARPSSRQLSLNNSMAALTAADVDPLEAHISNVSAAQKTAAVASTLEAEEAERLAALAKAAAHRSNYMADLSDAARVAASTAAACKVATDKYNELVSNMPASPIMADRTLTPLEDQVRDTHSTQKPAIQNSQKPVVQNSQKPAMHDSQKPRMQDSQKPVLQNSQKPVMQNSQKPVLQNSQKPVPQNSQKPVLQNSQKPIVDDSSSSSDDSADSDDSSDGDDKEFLENEPDVEDNEAEHDAQLHQPVTLPVFRNMLTKLDMNEDEASNIYDSVRQVFTANGGKYDATVGVPLSEFLDDLNIECRDSEGIQRFLEVFEQARQEPISREAQRSTTPGGRQAIQNSVFDKLVRFMDFNKVPAKDAHKIILNAGDTMSKAEYAVLESFALLPKELAMRVERHQVAPPLMNSSAGQTSCKEICSRRVTEIIDACKASGTKFTDPEWDITSAPFDVLYVDRQGPGYDCTVAEPAKYRRLTSIVKKSTTGMVSLFGGFGGKRPKVKPLVFKGNVSAGDIVQGQIGTCFLLGAIGAIASQREKSFQKIFVKYDVDVGVYGVRFCVDGEWTSVIVDDWMPVDYNGDLLYARCRDPQEVWVPLLEKAFCKMACCYEMCDGGLASEAIIAFFGGVAGFFKITEKHRKRPSLYFKLLRNAINKGWLLTASFVARPGKRSQGSGKCGEDMLPCGLVGGHAYSVLELVEAHGHQLICCRNPWGSGEWTGKWSDRNEFGEWTEEMIEATGFTKENDGKFWMSIDEFVTNSGGVDYARTFGPNWKKMTHYAHFQNAAFEATAKRKWKGRRDGQLSFSKGDQIVVKTMEETWWSGELKSGRASGFFPGRFVRLNDRSVLRFDLCALPCEGSTEPIHIIVMLMQRNAMTQRRFIQLDNGLNYKDTSYPQLGLFIVNPQGKIHVQRKRHARCVWGEVICQGGGDWRVYAYSHAGSGAACLLRTYIKGGTLTFKEVPGTKFSEVAEIMANTDSD